MPSLQDLFAGVGPISGPATPQVIPNAPTPPMLYQQPHGMFGMHGTVRDIVGALGDAFLTQSGNPRMYEPQREQERLSEAMRGFANDPMAAIQRIAEFNPEAAWQMQTQLAAQQVAQQRADADSTKAGMEYAK